MKKKILAIFVAAILVLSVFTVGVFAADDDEVVLLGAEEETENVTEEAEVTEAEATEAEPTEAAQTPTTTGAETTGESSNWIENHKSLFIAIIVIVAIALIVFIIYLVSPKFKAKFKKFWKDFNAEFKKLVWPTKKQLVRNSAVVLVTIVIAGALLALLDLGFHQGMYALKDLVKYIWPVQ